MSLTKYAYGWTVSGRKKHTVKARPEKAIRWPETNICIIKKYFSKHTFFIKTFLSCCLLAKEALRIQFLLKLETILSLIFNAMLPTYRVAGTVTYTECLQEKDLQPCLPGALRMEREKNRTQTNTIVTRLFESCVLGAYLSRVLHWTAAAFPQLLEKLEKKPKVRHTCRTALYRLWRLFPESYESHNYVIWPRHRTQERLFLLKYGEKLELTWHIEVGSIL